MSRTIDTNDKVSSSLERIRPYAPITRQSSVDYWYEDEGIIGRMIRFLKQVETDPDCFPEFSGRIQSIISLVGVEEESRRLLTYLVGFLDERRVDDRVYWMIRSNKVVQQKLSDNLVNVIKSACNDSVHITDLYIRVWLTHLDQVDECHWNEIENIEDAEKRENARAVMIAHAPSSSSSSSSSAE